MADEELHRCAADAECACWARTQYESPDGTKRKWICDQCSWIYVIDGWRVVSPLPRCPECGGETGYGNVPMGGGLGWRLRCFVCSWYKKEQADA